MAMQTTYIAVVGGTTSVIGGRKFANGAETAAFGYLFNCVAHKCYLFSPNSDGAYKVGNPNNSYYAQSGTIDQLNQIGIEWTNAGGTQKITVTELSPEVGGTTQHASHQDGQDVDIRPMSTNGAPTTWRSSNYDQASTQRLVNTVLNVNPNATIYFNDPSIQGVKPYFGHDNHLHIHLP